MCIYNMRKKQKKEERKRECLYIHTKQRKDGLYVHLYKGKKEKRKRQNKEPVYMHTKKKQERKKENPCIYAHQTFGRERLCASIQGKREKEKRGCGYIYTLKGVVCAAITAERKTKEKMKSRLATLFLHCFFAFLCFADVCTIDHAAMRKGAKEKEKRERRKKGADDAPGCTQKTERESKKQKHRRHFIFPLFFLHFFHLIDAPDAAGLRMAKKEKGQKGQRKAKQKEARKKRKKGKRYYLFLARKAKRGESPGTISLWKWRDRRLKGQSLQRLK